MRLSAEPDSGKPSATGFAAHANVRNDELEKELAALMKRGGKLERTR